MPQLHIPDVFSEDTPLNTPSLDFEKSGNLDEFFVDFESVAFPTLIDMSSSFDPTVSTASTTTICSTSTPTSSYAGKSSTHTDDDSSMFYDESIVKEEKFDMTYETTHSPASSSEFSQSVEDDLSEADMDCAAKKEVMDACAQLSIPHSKFNHVYFRYTFIEHP